MDIGVLSQWKDGFKQKNYLEDLKVHVLHQWRRRKLCVQPISCADCFQTHEDILTSDKLSTACPLVKACATPNWFLMQSKEEQMLSAMFCALSRDWQNALMFFGSFNRTAEGCDSETSKENVSEDLKVHVLHQRRGSKLCVQSISRADVSRSMKKSWHLTNWTLQVHLWKYVQTAHDWMNLAGFGDFKSMGQVAWVRLLKAKCRNFAANAAQSIRFFDFSARR